MPIASVSVAHQQIKRVVDEASTASGRRLSLAARGSDTTVGNFLPPARQQEFHNPWSEISHRVRSDPIAAQLNLNRLREGTDYCRHRLIDDLETLAS